jgi:hypothetical protein
MGEKKTLLPKKFKNNRSWLLFLDINKWIGGGRGGIIYTSNCLLPKKILDHNLLFELTSQKVQHSTNTKRSLIKLTMFKLTCLKCLIELWNKTHKKLQTLGSKVHNYTNRCVIIPLHIFWFSCVPKMHLDQKIKYLKKSFIVFVACNKNISIFTKMFSNNLHNLNFILWGHHVLVYHFF